MSSNGLQETREDLSPETRDSHRALLSLREELEAIDWYRQRSDAVGDPQLKQILIHNMREEMEHAAMLIEWLRRHDCDLNNRLRSYLFTTAPITQQEEEKPLQPPVVTDTEPTIGALKE